MSVRERPWVRILMLGLAVGLLGCDSAGTGVTDSRVDSKVVAGDGAGARDGGRGEARPGDGKPAGDAIKKADGKLGSDGGTTTACGPTLVCVSATQVCVVKEAWTKTYACLPVPGGCDSKRDCACLGQLLCTGAFNICSDAPAGTTNLITCSCPAC